MRGCRALSAQEVEALLSATPQLFARPVAARSYTMFLTMPGTGLRVGECRKLRVRDVSLGGHVGTSAYIEARHTKTKQHGAQVPLQPRLRDALRAWLAYSGLRERDVWLFPATTAGFTDRCIFKRNGDGSTVPVDHRTVRKALDKVCRHCGITGKVSTHSFRKTFAARVYEATGHDHLAAQVALRHSRLESTIAYLQADHAKAHAAIMGLFDDDPPPGARQLELVRAG